MSSFVQDVCLIQYQRTFFSQFLCVSLIHTKDFIRNFKLYVTKYITTSK